MDPVTLPLRILIVDDNEDAADSLSDLLILFGADVRTCYDAACALAEAEGFDFHVGVLDVHMPRMSGLELAPRLRRAAAPRAVYLVALTGVSDDRARELTALAGFDLHLTKASDVGTLLAPLAAVARTIHAP